MSQTKKAEFLIESRGVHRALDAFVVAARFSRDGRTLAFAMGDGTVHLVPVATPAAAWRAVPVHDGAVLSFAADTGADGFISGGDDGTLRRIAAHGTAGGLAAFGMKWVEQLASHALEKGKGLIAAGVGRTVHLFDETGKKLKEWTHPSTVTGLAFDSKGKRVAASHYNGVTLWFVAAKTDNPRRLEWKGSHIALAFHPDGDAVVTAMQENALHGWRLPDGQHMRMSGYPAKTTSLSFSKGGKWLASSGADSMVLWPFFGGGPMGKAPIELAGGDGINCTQVAGNPRDDLVAGGFEDGLVVVADIASSRILPIVPPGHGPITALAWSADGTRLAIGTERGYAGIVDFAPAAGVIRQENGVNDSERRPPKLGFGTYRMNGAVCQAAVESALAMGYRHIDTGRMYGNEDAVGAGIAAAGLPRGALFLTGKVCHALATPAEARAALDETLHRLQTDYLDLCLLHWPRAGLDIPGILEMLTRAQEAGKTRRVGVANFPLRLLRMAVDEVQAPIFCNQVEYHVLLDQTPLLTWLRAQGMMLIAHVPLAQGRLADHPALSAIAARHRATPAQVALKWLLDQDGVAAIPKAGRPESQRENLGAPAVMLDDADRAAIAALPKDQRFVNPPFAPEWD